MLYFWLLNVDPVVPNKIPVVSAQHGVLGDSIDRSSSRLAVWANAWKERKSSKSCCSFFLPEIPAVKALAAIKSLQKLSRDPRFSPSSIKAAVIQEGDSFILIAAAVGKNSREVM